MFTNTIFAKKISAYIRKLSRTLRIIGILYLVLIITFFLTAFFLSDKIQVDTPGICQPVVHLVTLKPDSEGPDNVKCVSVTSSSLDPLSFAAYSMYWKVAKIPFRVVETPMKSELPTAEDFQWRNRESRIQSYYAAFIAASRLAGKDIEYQRQLIFSANGQKDPRYKLERGDEILTVCDQVVKSPNDVITILRNHRNINATINVKRKGRILTLDTSVTDFGSPPQLLTRYAFPEKPPINIKDTPNDQGPSAGLAVAILFYLQMTNQTIKSDTVVTATGTIDENGYVGQIGGIDFKVIAANKANSTILFVPRSQSFGDSNEILARKTAEQIKASALHIQPVATLAEAVAFLKKSGIILPCPTSKN
ncbi:hypothetical protein G7K71_18725 [Desulfofundulus sp. TPOSR]|uniref:S16 family serine protease n=1 Tax=Desulfofundulus sp. TPOSR TaxID=2714340 RepID=UPI00140B2090|nr:S16 family serine protease [Desulfofundulus sp. TPOSR]NHM28960.1 hypothetical protein [Desulfofundulus sp. TPOSR]